MGPIFTPNMFLMGFVRFTHTVCTSQYAVSSVFLDFKWQKTCSWTTTAFSVCSVITHLFRVWVCDPHSVSAIRRTILYSAVAAPETALLISWHPSSKILAHPLLSVPLLSAHPLPQTLMLCLFTLTENKPMIPLMLPSFLTVLLSSCQQDYCGSSHSGIVLAS